MIRFIVAIDNKMGLSDENGIPWQGLLPNEVAYFRNKISTGTILMGYGTYKTLKNPFADKVNYVASGQNQELRAGFMLVLDAREFLTQSKDDVWVIGGASIFSSTLDLADELFITKINSDFNCTKFFPEFDVQFELVSASDIQEESNISYVFQVWRRK